MSISTFSITDAGKSGVLLEYLRPKAAEHQPPAAQAPSPAKQGTFTVTRTNRQSTVVIASRPGTGASERSPQQRSSSAGRPVGTKSVSYAPAEPDDEVEPFQHTTVLFECPVQFAEGQRTRPEWLPMSLVQATRDVAQEYGLLLDQTQTNIVSNTERIRDVAMRYYKKLRAVQDLTDELATDIDCVEALEEEVSETMAACLYNVGLSHLLCAHQAIGEVASGAIQHLCEAAGTFDYLLNAPIAEDSEKPELSEDNLRVLSCVALATAHEVSLQFYYSDTYHQVDENAALAHGAAYYYTMAAAIVHSSVVVPSRDALLNFLHIKRLMLEGLMMFIKSLEIGTTKGTSRRRKAIEAFEEALQYVLRVMPGDRRLVEMEIAWYNKRCSKFRKICKKGRMPEGTFTNKKRRSDDFRSLIPLENITATYPLAIADLVAEDKRRAEEGVEGAGATLEELLADVDDMRPPSGMGILGSHDGIHEAGSEAGDSAAQDFDHIQLASDTYVENQDIRLIPPPIAPSATRYHLITAMVALKAPTLKPPTAADRKKVGEDEFALSTSSILSLSARSVADTVVTTKSLVSQSQRQTLLEEAQNASQQPACSHCALVLIVDVHTQDQSVAYGIKAAIAFALRCGRLTEQDRIGLVTFNKFGEPSLSIISATVDNVSHVADSIVDARASGKFEGARGPALMEAVMLAANALASLEETEANAPAGTHPSTAAAIASWTGNKSIVFVGDGLSNALPSDYANWLSITNTATRRRLSDLGIPVHVFISGDAADHGLLETLATATRGNLGSQIAMDENVGVDKVRTWFVGILSGMKQRVASNISLELECAQGILLANIVTETFTEPPRTDYDKLLTKATVPVLPIACENESNILITFAVPATHCKRDVIDLAQAKLRFFDSIRCTEEVRLLEIKNVCSKRILSREIHFWLTALQAQECRGPVHVQTANSTRSLVRGSEFFSSLDTITTGEKGHLSLVAVDGTRFDLRSNTTMLIETSEANSITVLLTKGGLTVTTSNDCKVQITVDNAYAMKVEASSFASVHLDKNGDMSANCVVGTAVIETLEVKTDPLLLAAPRQTIARMPEAPLTPWIVTEKTFFGWIARDTDVSRYLKNKIRIETHVWRTKTAVVLHKVSRIVGRSLRVGTLKQTVGNMLGGQVAAYALLAQTKNAMSNSIAYSTSNKILDRLRKAIDEAGTLSSSAHRHMRSNDDWSAIKELATAAGRQRSVGGCKLFTTSDTPQQVQMQLSEKARFEALLAEQREREIEESRNHEALRRIEQLATTLVKLDFGATNRVLVKHLLTIWADLPAHIDAAPSVEGILRAVGGASAINEDQFSALFIHATQHLTERQFSAFAETLQTHVERTADLVEGSRLARSLYSLFGVLDHAGLGTVPLPRLAFLLQETFGDTLVHFRRVEAMTAAAAARRTELVDAARARPILDEAAPHDGPHWARPAPEDPLTVQLSLSVFIAGMTAYAQGVPESAAQTQINQLYNVVAARNPCPKTMEAILDQQRTEKELQHLLTWDRRHIFDGVSAKDVRACTSPQYVSKNPEALQAACAAVCALAGITAPVVRRKGPDDAPVAAVVPAGDEAAPRPASSGAVFTDYWAAIRERLQGDHAAFHKELAAFPQLSITHRQALRVSAKLEDRRIPPEVMHTITPVVGQLLSWVRLMLRVAHLTHRYDLTVPVVPRLMSEAAAVRIKAPTLFATPIIADTVRPQRTPLVVESSPRLCRTYEKVFDLPARPDKGFGEVTKFYTEPPSPTPPLGRPQLRVGRPAGTAAADLILKIDARRFITDDERPTTSDAVNTSGSMHSQRSPEAGPSKVRSVLSFKSLDGTPQRIERAKSQTVTSKNSAYLRKQGSQIRFGPSHTTDTARTSSNPNAQWMRTPRPPSSAQPTNQSIADVTSEQGSEVAPSEIPPAMEDAL